MQFFDYSLFFSILLFYSSILLPLLSHSCSVYEIVWLLIHIFWPIRFVLGLEMTRFNVFLCAINPYFLVCSHKFADYTPVARFRVVFGFKVVSIQIWSNFLNLFLSPKNFRTYDYFWESYKKEYFSFQIISNQTLRPKNP